MHYEAQATPGSPAITAFFAAQGAVFLAGVTIYAKSQGSALPTTDHAEMDYVDGDSVEDEETR
jgi:hypothetical protein